MKKSILFKIYLATFLCLPFVLASCSDDEDEKGKLTTLTFSAKEISLNKLGLDERGEIALLDVASNRYWKAEVKDADWLTLQILGDEGQSEAGGYLETEIKLLVEPSNVDEERFATIQFTTLDNVVETVTVKQEGNKQEVFYFDENIDGDIVEGKLPVSVYSAWQREGLSSSSLRFFGEGIYVTDANPSKGYEGASGKNNIFFSHWEDDPTANLALLSSAIPTRGVKAFSLNFATAVNENATKFDKEDFKVMISKDNVLWSEMPYERSEGKDWEKTELKFYFDAPHKYIFFRFLVKDQDKYHLDDIQLFENEEGVGHYEDFIAVIDDDKPIGFTYFEDDFKWSEKEKKTDVTWAKDGLAMPYHIPMTTNNREEIRLDYDDKPNRAYKYFDGLYEAKLASGWSAATTAVRVYVSYGCLKSGTTASLPSKADGILVSPRMSKITKGAYVNMKVTIKASLYANEGGARDKGSFFTVSIPDDLPGTIGDAISKSKTFELTQYPPDTDEITFYVYGVSSDTFFNFRSPNRGETIDGDHNDGMSKRLYYRYFKFEKAK